MLETYREIFKYRALLRALVARHLSMRYRGSFLGFFWSILNPLCLMAVYTMVFRYYMRFEQVDNYTIVLFCGLLPWLWISSSLIEGTSSIVSSGHLITKSMFPAHLLPAVSVITNMVNYLLSLPLLFIFMAAAGVPFHSTVILLPIVVAAQLAFLHGLSLACSALNVHFRDVQHIVANLLTFIFFLCPIIYPVDVIPENLRFTLFLNPFAILTAIYHDIIIAGILPSLKVIGAGIGYMALSMALGNFIYSRYRESFAELL